MASAKLTMLLDLSDKVSSKFASIQNKFERGASKMRESFSEITAEIPFLDRALDIATNKWVLLGAGIMAVGSLFVNATKQASDWHTQLAEVNVTAGMSQKELQGLSNKLLDIGARNVAPLEEVPKAFNRIISAGLDVNQSMQALEPTLRAAKAGFVDIETVASAGIATMTSSGEDINRVYDILFQTVKDGNASFKDIANYLPKVVPMARNLGYELEDTAGAFASLTTKLSAEASSTALEGIMRALSNPDIAIGKMDKTGKMVSGFKALGIEVFSSTGKIRPMVEIVEQLNKKLTGLTDEQRVKQLSKLGFDESASRGFSILSQDLEGLKKATDNAFNSQGALNKAYFDSVTPMEQLSIIQNMLKAMMIKMGEKILPIVASALDALRPVINAVYNNFDDIVSVLKVLIPVAGGLFLFYKIATAFTLASQATKGLTVAQWLLNTAMSANPIGLIVIAIGALIAYITIAIVKFEKFGALMLWIMGPIGRIISGFLLIRTHWDSITEAFEKGGIIGGLKRIGIVLLDVFLKPLQQLLELFSKIPGLGKHAKAGADKLLGIRTKMKLVTPEEEEAKNKKEDKTKPKTDPLKGLYGSVQNTKENKEGKTKLASDVTKVTGESQQIRNITFNIGSLIKGDINMNDPKVQGMSQSDFESYLEEMFMRMVRNAENA
ncbi:phage tail tape measure protein [Flavobacterium oreochromis]|uniref:phage tail tape measure protein n=1 Tax=Flavobacterium oreochromis TaxID=2906078 RepID=UPI000CDB98FA|nr:phage tail tape measure protein [Flavobacterium columnare]